MMKGNVILAVVTIALAMPAIAKDQENAKPTSLEHTQLRVIDGDTIQYRKTKIRLMGYDTPEVRRGEPGYCEAKADLAKQATAALEDFVAGPHRVTLRWAKGKDKYGRSLAWLYSDGKDIGPQMIAKGLAKPYDGKTKTPWC
jgi:micrococcal nuclease